MKVLLVILGLAGAGVCFGQSPLPEELGSRVGGDMGSHSGLLFVSSRAVPLFVQREGAGVLPVRTIVEAQPSEDAARLRLWHEGRMYEADASAFRPERELMQDLARYETDVRQRYQDAARTYDQKFSRLNALEEKARHFNSADGQMVVVFPAPAPLDGELNRTTNSELIVLEKAQGPGRPALIQREIRKLSREVAKLEQQLADMEREGQRIVEVRNALERRFSDYRMARHAP